MKTILVLGAGELGFSVLRSLADSRDRGDWHISVLLRPAHVNAAPRGGSRELFERDLRSIGVSLEEADVAAASVEQLAGLFARFNTVINCMGFVAGQGTQLKLTDAAIQAGVRRYVPWQFGINYDQITVGSGGGIFDEQIAVRALLRGQTHTSWLVVSTGMFTSFLFEPSFGVVDFDNRRVNALGSWDTTVSVTAPHDIGRLTCELLIRVPEGGGQVYYVAGDTISYESLADNLERHFSYSFERVAWVAEHLKHELDLDSTNVMKKYRVAFATEPGVAWHKSSTFNVKQELQTQNVAEWIKANLPLHSR